jgi:AcrR family transcriptional regulator
MLASMTRRATPPALEGAPSARGARTRTHILAAARDILIEEGFAAISIRRVARRAALAPGNVSFHFPVLDQLLMGLVDHIVGDYINRLGGGPSGNPATALRELESVVAALVDDLKTPQTAALFLEIWSIARHSETASSMMTSLYDQERLFLEQYIQAVSPAMPPDVRARRATLIAMQIEGMLLVLAPGRPRRAWHRGLKQELIACARFLATAPWQTGASDVSATTPAARRAVRKPRPPFDRK